MHRVKFNVNTEYGYINNMKVLQSKLWPKSRLQSQQLTMHSSLLHETPDRPQRSRAGADQMQDARQPGVPAMDKAVLGPKLPRRRVRCSGTAKICRGARNDRRSSSSSARYIDTNEWSGNSATGHDAELDGIATGRCANRWTGLSRAAE